jgi:type I restriction enzyme, S subunit
MADMSWGTKLLGDLAAPDDGAIAIGPFGSSMKSDVYVAEGIPVVRGTNLDGRPGFRGEFVFVTEETADTFSRCLIAPGDLVFPHRGAIGSVGLAVDQPPGRWLLSTSMMKFRADRERLDPMYAFHFFRSDRGRHELLKNASQVGTPGIGQPLASLRACEIPAPPIDEQRAIAGVLGALDAKIEHNQRTAQSLERLAQAIFRAWFVDFEPVKAKIAGATSFPSMSQPAFDALPTRLVDSDIGPMPEGWEVKSLSTVATFLNGLALQKYPPRGDGTDLRVIKIAELRKGSTTGADWANADVPAQYVVDDRDLLFSWSGTLEAEFWFGGRGALNQHLFKVTSSYFPSWFFLLWIQQHLPWFRTIASSKATTMGHIKREHLQEAKVVVPLAAIIREGDSAIGSLYALHAVVQIESRKLAAMRDLLLPKLLSGEVRVAAIKEPERE